MKKLKKESDRKRRLSISMSPKLYDLIDENSSNKSRYVESALLYYFYKNGIDVSKIKL